MASFYERLKLVMNIDRSHRQQCRHRNYKSEKSEQGLLSNQQSVLDLHCFLEPANVEKA